jgi:tetratricopeptide (TPR) repeat protein
VQANILEPRSDRSTFAFAHPLINEVLYDRLAADRRASLHGSAGRALEATSRFQPALHELAYHFHHAPMEPYYESAAHYGRLAGDASMRALAYEEALEYYGWALEAQTHVPLASAEDACELLLLSGAAYAMAGRLAEARERCERAIELAREAKLPELLIRAAQQLRPTVWIAQMPDALAERALQDALAMLPETASAARSRALGQLAYLPPCSLNLEASEQLSNEALGLARSTHDTTLVLVAQRARLFALSGADTIDEQLRTADEILRDDPESASRFRGDALFASYHALLKRGDRAGAERALESFEHCGRKLRLLLITWHADRLRIQSALSAGRLDEAESQFEGLFARGEQLRIPLSFAYRAALLQSLSWERTGKRQPTVDQDMAIEAGWIMRLPEFRSRRIYLAVERGEVDAARRDFAGLAETGFEAVLGSAFSLIALVSLSAAACIHRVRKERRLSVRRDVG